MNEKESNMGINKAKAFWQAQEDCEIKSGYKARLLVVLRVVLGTNDTC